MSATAVAEAVNASSVAELSWLDAQGTPHVRGVVALVDGNRPALAFTYADIQVAHSVAQASTVQLAMRETRSTAEAFRPLLLHGTPHLSEDPRGERFISDLLGQELRRYPPSRLYADSPLLMREHWWYLPRLVVTIDVAAIEPIAARTDDAGHLLVVGHQDRPEARAAKLGQSNGDRLELDLDGPAPGVGPAVLFGQDASFPDLERWSQWRYRGWWDGTLVVTDAPERTGLAPSLGLLGRWRRERSLQQRCVAALSSR